MMSRGRMRLNAAHATTVVGRQEDLMECGTNHPTTPGLLECFGKAVNVSTVRLGRIKFRECLFQLTVTPL